MLRKTQMQEIQDLKLRSYTKAEILTYYKEQGLKPPRRIKKLRFKKRKLNAAEKSLLA